MHSLNSSCKCGGTFAQDLLLATNEPIHAPEMLFVRKYFVAFAQPTVYASVMPHHTTPSSSPVRNAISISSTGMVIGTIPKRDKNLPAVGNV